MSMKAAAQKAISLLDFTNLNDSCTEADIEDLAARGQTAFGNVAALCIFPRFVKTAKNALGEAPIKIATVTNFPDGSDDELRAARETADAFAMGADEVDLVIAYRAVLNGEHAMAAKIVAAAAKEKPAGRILKCILETGELKDEQLIRTACRIALDNGADFLKTSTGKVAVNATLSTSRLLMEEIKASGRDAGFKAAGGIKTTEDAAAYLALGGDIMGEKWLTADHFRFGASGVLDDLIASASGTVRSQAKAGY